MEFCDFPMDMSPLSYEFEDFFAKDGGSLDEEVTTINPDEFLNLDEFKTENESPPLQQSLETPPISPQSSSIIIDSALYQNIRFIPITTLKCSSQQFTPKPTKKIKVLFPKPSSSSDSDTNPNIHQTDMISINPKIPVTPVDRAIIKQQRLIRNRESAIQSRKKKKDYVVTLETENSVLRKENCLLKAENSRLKERINVYSKFTCRCASTISNKLTTARNGTFMLAVIFLVGFNIFPMGNLLNSHYKQPLKEQSHEFHSRNLLFANENVSIDGNNTETLELSEQSIYLNQTTKILNANIENIRRWIPAPDLNVTYPKTFDFEPDPMQDKLLKMYEETWEQSQKSNKKKRKPKKNPAEPVQLYNPKNNLVKLSEFFEEIQRKDDVFYVFSFRADHLLLPASDNNYNVSQIKMNLLMPRSNDSMTNDKITMLQIETLIINTSLIQITEKSIPSSFKMTHNSTAASCNEKEPLRSSQEFNSTKNIQNMQPPMGPLTKDKFPPSYYNSFDFLKYMGRK